MQAFNLHRFYYFTQKKGRLNIKIKKIESSLFQADGSSEGSYFKMEIFCIGNHKEMKDLYSFFNQLFTKIEEKKAIPKI